MAWAREQQLAALGRANDVRALKSQVKQRMKAGELDPIEILEAGEIPLRVEEFLRAIPGVAHVKAAKFCRTLQIPTYAKLGGTGRVLTDREVRCLRDRLYEVKAVRER